jgi:SAM-dependent methyltransferase
MNINAFRFFSAEDPYDDTPNWSRRYEWNYVLGEITRDLTLRDIHNTCCGPGLIHKFFHDRLNALGRNVVNSDLEATEVNKSFSNFCHYDLTQACSRSFDCVLCISTLEELRSENDIKTAFNNLLAQTRPGGRLILTFDYPDVRLELFESLLQRKCQATSQPLSGANSSFPDLRFADLRVILLDITS